MEKKFSHLKQFVKKHPENKMAWYLLGKEYLQRGQEAKAAYCFAQSGEIFEAYEAVEFGIKVEDIQAASKEVEAAPGPKRKKWTGIVKKTIAVLLLFLVCILLQDPSVSDPYSQGPQQDNPQTAPPHSAQEPQPQYLYIDHTLNPYAESWMNEFYTFWKETKDDGNEWAVIAPIKQTAVHWLQPGDLQVVVSGTAADQISSLQIESHHPILCDCETGPFPLEEQVLSEWKAIQEDWLTAKSAVHHYEQLNGVKPSQPQDLLGDYPNNLISGLTDSLAEAVNLVLSNDQSNPVWETELNTSASNGQDPRKAKFTLDRSMPELEIIVDKSNHRLALVSGDMVLRNYPVGLGGDRTPEGEFEITEKVVNPNGRSDGDFGSRGMTLSDTLYAIHGTNEPESIGKDESLGCVRMEQEDVEELFAMVPLGTKVTVVNDGSLPEEIIRGASPYKLPSQVEETNPTKVYRWLN
ncbi:L,D-transpeptidase family protein [Marinicrinis lubricantis]|uniref:L,D-transpeptidase family protein n=1 Tax=Marinicrinis lubricantis TaxID=2086470 RepID=A0ABW1ITA1_9BACL